MIDHLILDWSGTLVDDLGPVHKTTNHVLSRCGLAELSLDQFRREFCLPVAEFYRGRVPHLSLPELEAMFLERYQHHRHEICLLPHTESFLRFCAAQGLGVYVASSADPLTYQTQMSRFGLAGYIAKPYLGIVDKTEMIHQILAENGLDPGRTLFVGDMEHDLAAGKAGGVRTCAVLTGYNHSDKLRALEPDLVCADLGELQAWLAGQTQAGFSGR